MDNTKLTNNFESISETKLTIMQSSSNESSSNLKYVEEKETQHLQSFNNKNFVNNGKPSKTLKTVQHFLQEGVTPKDILSYFFPHYTISEKMSEEFVLEILFELFSDQNTRTKLPNYNTFEQAVELLKTKNRILVLTGAGVSVSCGIPDFRSENGIYSRLHKDFPELPNPSAMFDINFFKKNPIPFYNFAKEIFPGQFNPSISHMFIKFLEESQKLLRNYTQNIDTLEQIAGIKNVVECHGSFAKSTCLNCGNEIDSCQIKKDVFAQKVAHCKKCLIGVVKPNIVFFGEDLSEKFYSQIAEDREKADLVVVIGSSLKVRPVALIPYQVHPDVPQILINREELEHYPADIKLLGNSDEIIISLCMAMGGDFQLKILKELENRSIFSTYLSLFKSNNLLTSQLPQIINVEKFKELTNEPLAKKPCYYNGNNMSNDKDSAPQTERENTKGSDETLWESNYITVSDILPQYSYLFVPQNLNVFKGAALYYERDNETFCAQPGPVLRRFYDEDDDNELHRNCNSSLSSNSKSFDDDSSSDYYRAMSIPPTTKFCESKEETSNFDTELEILKKTKRATSCPVEMW